MESLLNWWEYLDSFSDLVAIVDRNSRIFYANESFQNFTGLTPMTIKRNPSIWEVLSPPKDFPDKLENIEPKWLDRYLDTQVLDSSGNLIPFQVLLVHVKEPMAFSSSRATPDFPLYLISMRDVSIEIRMNDKYKTKLKENQELISQLKRKIAEVEYLRRLLGLVSYKSEINEIFEKAREFGLEMLAWETFLWIPESGIGEDPIETFSKQRLGSHTQELLVAIKPAVQMDFDSNTWIYRDLVIMHLKTRLGTNYWLLIQQSSKGLSDHDFFDSLHSQIAQLIDNHALSLAAITDPLTKVYNRRFFDGQLSIEVSKSTEADRPLSLMVVDVDHFKSVNDQHGHPVGDQVLIRIAEILREAVRVDDLVARIGGEEFAVLMPNTSQMGAKILAERIREKIAEEIIPAKSESQIANLRVTVSCGVAQLSQNYPNADSVYKAADEALYHAKATGRNNVKLAA